MYKIFAVLCIIGCTLAKEKATSPSSESNRRLKARQVGSIYGLEHYVEPVHHVVDYLHEPQVIGSPVHYVEPSVVSIASVQTAAPLVQPVGPAHQVYSYVPSVGYGHPYNYRYHSSSATPFSAYTPVSSQQISRVQSPQAAVYSAFTQGSQQSGLAQVAQQAGFSQETQQAGFTQGTQSALSQESLQSAFAQGTQQSSSVQGNQQSSSQSQLQTDNAQTVVGQIAQQTETQQSDSSQNSQGAQQIPSQQNGRFQFGILHSGFGQQQQFGIVQTPSSQGADSQFSFGQRQEAVSDQSGSGQSAFGASQQSGSISTQQSSGSFSPSTAVSTVAIARQQPVGSQAVSQQNGGSVSPASTSSIGSQNAGFSATQATPTIRLIQPYNLSPSYAIHGLGFRTIQSGSSGAFVSGTQEAQVSSSQNAGSTSQQFTPIDSGFQFSSQGQSSGSQESAQAGDFRSGNTNPSGIQYSYTSQQSASQPATVRSGSQASSSAGVQGSTSADGQGSLSSYRSSFISSADASQDSSSGFQNTSPTQQPPAILRMSNDLSFDGSFNYGFESENGISSSAVGSLRTIDAQHPAQIISGSYSYTAPDGTPISTNYYADETGFHAQGAHLPTPHPLPEYVARALEILPQQGNTDQVQPTVESN